MTARNRFSVGQRVELSPRGRGFSDRGTLGTVTGFEPRDSELVRVKHDGDTHGRAYHMGYWQAATEAAGDTNA